MGTVRRTNAGLDSGGASSMVNRVLTGAHYGLKDWIIQRMCSVLTLMLIWPLIFIFLLFFPHSYAGWQSFFSFTLVKLIVQLVILARIAQFWISTRDMWMDYIKPPGLRLFLHTATFLWLLLCLMYSVTIIWGE